ncbi:hypothetical protein JZ751_003317 [Albula glossodonta]|uniref:BLOC-1-related complex subunit 6 C-terminal helix domain-containing protein n=1 Tax=Albula glossodonta TaxID=121402 RepID=A0A8T2NB96_9TELE|nr:hypothetical protein JZ751_003317 [Albula glossodonta]
MSHSPGIGAHVQEAANGVDTPESPKLCAGEASLDHSTPTPQPLKYAEIIQHRRPELPEGPSAEEVNCEGERVSDTSLTCISDMPSLVKPPRDLHSESDTVEAYAEESNTLEAETEESNTLEAEIEESNTLKTQTEESNTLKTQTEESNTLKTQTEQSNTLETQTEQSNTFEVQTDESNTVEVETEESNPVQTLTNESNTLEGQTEGSNTLQAETEHSNSVDAPTTNPHKDESHGVETNMEETHSDSPHTDTPPASAAQNIGNSLLDSQRRKVEEGEEEGQDQQQEEEEQSDEEQENTQEDSSQLSADPHTVADPPAAAESQTRPKDLFPSEGAESCRHPGRCQEPPRPPHVMAQVHVRNVHVRNAPERERIVRGMQDSKSLDEISQVCGAMRGRGGQAEGRRATISSALELEGTVSRDGELTHFITKNLEHKIRMSSRPSLDSDSDYPVRGRGSLRRPVDIPPIDPNVLLDLQRHTQDVAQSMTALSVGYIQTYRDSVDSLGEAVDMSIKGMYTLMARCEELDRSMQPIHGLAQQIRDVKRTLDALEALCK